MILGNEQPAYPVGRRVHLEMEQIQLQHWHLCLRKRVCWNDRKLSRKVIEEQKNQFIVSILGEKINVES